MAHILDDVVDWIASEITEVSLHIDDPGDDGSNEYEGGDYERVVPSFGPSENGEAPLTSPLQFDGNPNEGPITHVGIHRASGFWVGLAAENDPPIGFNSDGRINVAAMDIAQTFAPGS